MTAIAEFQKPDTLIITTNGGSSTVRRAAIVATSASNGVVAQHRPATSVITVKPIVKTAPNVCKIQSNVASLFTTSLLSPKQQQQQQQQQQQVQPQQTDKKIVLGSHSENMNVFRLTSTAVADDEDVSSIGADGAPRKRRRLTHLSPEEKIQRRKLKNRVAAQTARDRKKAQMSDMEVAIDKLQTENKKLLQQNLMLQKKTDTLMSENSELRKRLGQLKDGECNHLSTATTTTTTTTSSSSLATPTSSPSPSSSSSSSTCNCNINNSIANSSSLCKSESLSSPVKTESKCLRSAAETHFDAVSLDDTLQLFGSNDEPSKLWKFLDEVCNSESKNSTPSQSVTDSSCFGAAELLAEEDPNSMVGTATTQLDSLNELIKSEHFYVKPSPSPSPDSDSGPKSLMEICDILPCDAVDEGVFVDEEAIVPTVNSTVIVPDISDITAQEYDIEDNDDNNDDSSSSSTDGGYDFDPLTLLQDILQESVDSQEGKETNDILQLADLEKLNTSDLAEANNRISSSVMFDTKLRKSCDPAESEMKIPFETTYMDQFSDSASDSGINSEPGDPGSPYQDQLMTIPFNDMDPMDDCLLPEIFPCLV